MRPSSLFLLLFSSLHSAVSLPSETISTELRLSRLESGLDSTRSTLMEILRSFSMLSKQHAHTDKGNTTKAVSNEIDISMEQLQMKIENVTGVVMTAIMKEKFSSFQLTVARDLATVKVKCKVSI